MRAQQNRQTNARRALRSHARSSRILIGLGVLVLVATGTVAFPDVAAAQPAPEASTVDTGANAGSMTVAGGAAPTATSGVGDAGAGRSLNLLRPSESGSTTAPNIFWTIVPKADGTVNLVTQTGLCLSSVYATDHRDHSLVNLNTCNGFNKDQSYYFVPQNHTPATVDVHNRDYQYFYLVDAKTNQCVTAYGGMGAFAPTDSRSWPWLRQCNEAQDEQEFRVANERNNPLGDPVHWRMILNLAIKYGTNHCSIDTESCQILRTGHTQWLNPGSPGVADDGVFATQAAGCGVGFGGSSSQIRNATDTLIPVSLATTQSLSSSFSISNSVENTFSASLKAGVKDVWETKLSQSVTSGATTASTKASADGLQKTVSVDLDPGYWLMGTWTLQAYTMSGTWKFFTDTPMTNTISWTIPASSTIPVGYGEFPFGTYSPTISLEKKSCYAGPAATIVPGAAGEPKLTGDQDTCTQTTPTPVTSGAVGTTVSVCPGSWTLPADTVGVPARFHYQWYVATAGSAGTKTPILGATGPSYTIQPSTAGTGLATYLGVDVVEVGNANRLDSHTANPTELTLVKAGVGDPMQYATSFAGLLPEAQRNKPYRAALVGGAGSTMTLGLADGSTLPAGLELAADGTLSGMPSEVGSHTFAIVDHPTDGRPEQHHEFTLMVQGAEPAFASHDLTATLGEPAELPLVTSAPDGLALTVTDGALPLGLTLDASAGALVGTPEEAGSSTFTVKDTAETSTPVTFTVTVTPAAAVYADALPEAVIGQPYSASVVTSPGTSPFFALSSNSVPLTDGLTLNALTGIIEGVPSTTGATTVQLADVDGTVTASFTLVIRADTRPAAAAPTSTPSPSPASDPQAASSADEPQLAATGAANDRSERWAGGLILLVGAVLLILSRRRRSPTE